MLGVFNARAIFFWKPDRLYRIYVYPGELIFIRIGGQEWGGGWDQLGELGFLGWLLTRQLRGKIEADKQARLIQMEKIPPQVRIKDNKYNFRVLPNDLYNPRILSRRPFALHGYQVGRWKFNLRDGSSWTFQFE